MKKGGKKSAPTLEPTPPKKAKRRGCVAPPEPVVSVFENIPDEFQEDSADVDLPEVTGRRANRPIPGAAPHVSQECCRQN